MPQLVFKSQNNEKHRLTRDVYFIESQVAVIYDIYIKKLPRFVHKNHKKKLSTCLLVTKQCKPSIDTGRLFLRISGSCQF